MLFGLLGQTPAPKAPTDLDFWVGSWSVTAEGKHDGTDVVEKTLNGFAVKETWVGDDGGKGESLFYYMPAKKQWKQVWVTDVGAYKEKISEPVPGGIRFSGTIFLPGGRQVQDRTTLTHLPAGKVRQVIEFKAKDGKWTVSYDAVYSQQGDG
jgi:hypothetical protein